MKKIKEYIITHPGILDENGEPKQFYFGPNGTSDYFYIPEIILEED